MIATKVGAPSDVKPVKWRLLPDRGVKGFNDVVDLIDRYCAGREIALFIYVLKNACKVEALQLARINKLEDALAVYVVVAWVRSG